MLPRVCCRIAWLVGCLAIGLMLLYVREYTYPRFEKLVLPSADMLIALAVVPWLSSRFSLFDTARASEPTAPNKSRAAGRSRTRMHSRR